LIESVTLRRRDIAEKYAAGSILYSHSTKVVEDIAPAFLLCYLNEKLERGETSLVPVTSFVG